MVRTRPYKDGAASSPMHLQAAIDLSSRPAHLCVCVVQLAAAETESVWSECSLQEWQPSPERDAAVCEHTFGVYIFLELGAIFRSSILHATPIITTRTSSQYRRSHVSPSPCPHRCYICSRRALRRWWPHHRCFHWRGTASVQRLQGCRIRSRHCFRGGHLDGGLAEPSTGVLVT